MGVGVLMGRKKKVEGGSGGSPAERLSEGVKLRPTFKDKLELVAKDEGIFPGDLIERELGQYVEMHYVRVLKKRLKEAEDSGA